MKNFRKRFFRAALILLLAAFWGIGGKAVSVSAASQNSSVSGGGSITVTLKSKSDQVVTGGELTLYQVARLNGNRYIRTTDFADCTGVSLNDRTISSSATAETLAEYTQEKAVQGTAAANENGTVIFSNLEQGLYLVVQTQAADGYNAVSSFLVSVPLLENGVWTYDVDASPKVEAVSAASADPDPSNPDDPDPSDPDDPDPSNPDAPDPSDPDDPDPSDPDDPDPSDPDDPDSSDPDDPDPGDSDASDDSEDPDSSGGSDASGGSNVPTLPQTGQLNWPIPLLAGGGLLLIFVGSLLVWSGRRASRGELM